MQFLARMDHFYGQLWEPRVREILPDRKWGKKQRIKEEKDAGM